MTKIKIFTLHNCMFCNKLKDRLDEESIEYDDYNIDINQNKLVFEKIVERTSSENVPTVIVGKQILAPNVSFKTIEEGIEIIKKLLGK
jgi:glutaredoxin